MCLFISKTISPEEYCWWWFENQALKKRLAEPLAPSYSDENTQVTLPRLFLDLETFEITY